MSVSGSVSRKDIPRRVRRDIYDADTHHSGCKCHKCLAWWALAVANKESAIYTSPFTQEEIDKFWIELH